MKKKSSNKHKAPMRFAPLVPNAVKLGLKEAERLVDQDEPFMALAKLTELENLYPGHRPVLEMMLAGAIALEDPDRMITALEGLTRLGMDDGMTRATLIIAYRTAGFPALALEAGHAYLEAADKHDLEVLPISDQIDELEATIRRGLDEDGTGGDDEGLAIAVLFERARLRADQRRFAEARELCSEILARRPQYLPARNAIAQSHYFEGNIAEAIAVAETTLATTPEDLTALSLTAKYYLLAGQTEAANRMGERLKASTAPTTDRQFKITEILSYLGDDEGVLQAFKMEYPGPIPGKIIIPESYDAGDEQEEESDEEDDADDADDVGALMHHYAAVAACRLGQTDEAILLWEHALELDPDLEIAADNLDDLDLPIEERNGPWSFPLMSWVPQVILDELVRQMDPLMKGKQNIKAEIAAVSNLLERYPMLATTAASLLDRGDFAARNFVLMLSQRSRTPVINEAFRDFALGQRGPDDLRMIAAKQSFNLGLIPGGLVRMWIKGQWQEAQVP